MATNGSSTSNYCYLIAGNKTVCPLPLIPIAFVLSVALCALYYSFPLASVQSTPTPPPSSDVEKADLKEEIAAPPYVPFSPRSRSPPSYVHLPLEEQQERILVRSRLVAYRFPSPPGPPPFGPLPCVPMTRSQTPLVLSRNLDELYHEPACPDSPTLPIGLFASNNTVGFLPSACLTHSTSHLDYTLRNKGSTDSL
ncbi:hypothetical protein QCA50_006820 [Cerrena zonata]|uniref:Uncharacterized protein n=1 Tax=Cerrena zonata TaxID=2478898 RepID=A0AAW0GG69_9APHY